LPPAHHARLRIFIVAAANWFRYVYCAHFSRPKSVRQLYRLIRRHALGRIVELGVSDVARSVRLIEIAQRYADADSVRHTVLDEFESRPTSQVSLSVKEAYRALSASGANVRLVPGPPARSLTAVANSLQNTDLILISASVTDDALQGTWFYVPRMLHSGSVILRERGTMLEPTFDWLSHSQIAEWAGRPAARRVA
jgi:hypothetical protein